MFPFKPIKTKERKAIFTFKRTVEIDSKRSIGATGKVDINPWDKAGIIQFPGRFFPSGIPKFNHHNWHYMQLILLDCFLSYKIIQIEKKLPSLQSTFQRKDTSWLLTII